jgi:hypothetical protein
MNVTIGNQSCSAVTITDPVSLTSFSCVAPPGPGIGDVQLRVVVQSGGVASTPFLYDAPRVTRVSPSPCHSNTTCVVSIEGTNLGLKNPVMAPDPVIYIGGWVIALLLLRRGYPHSHGQLLSFRGCPFHSGCPSPRHLALCSAQRHQLHPGAVHCACHARGTASRDRVSECPEQQWQRDLGPTVRHGPVCPPGLLLRALPKGGLGLVVSCGILTVRFLVPCEHRVKCPFHPAPCPTRHPRTRSV